MMWNKSNALEIMAKRPSDLSREQQQTRITACADCGERVGNECLLSHQQITAQALRSENHCPLGKWAGDNPPTVYPPACDQADVIFYLGQKPPPGWWALKGRLAVDLLKSAEIPAVSLTSPNLALAIERYQPRLIVNRGLLVSPQETERLATEHPQIKFLAVNHSSTQFLWTTPKAWNDQADFLEICRRLPNCYLGTPDERNEISLPYPELAGKIRWIPNHAFLSPLPPKPQNDPPVVSLIAAGRDLKNLANQILGFAIAARQRPLHLLLSIRGEPARLERFKRFCRDLRISFEFRAWSDWPEYQALLSEVDIGLQCSFTESFNYVAIEQMLQGVPVIGSPAIRYLPRGWQVNPDSAQDLAQKILDVIGNPHSRPSARRVGLCFAKEQNHCFIREIGDLLSR